MNEPLETITVQRHGITWRVDIVADPETQLSDYSTSPDGPYTEADGVAWNNGDWRFVGVIVTAQVPADGPPPGHEFTNARFTHPEIGLVALTPSDALWAVEYGTLGGRDITAEVIANEYPGTQLMENVIATLQGLHRALSLLPVTATASIG